MTIKGKRLYFIGLVLIFLSVVFGNRIATMQEIEKVAAPPAPAPAAGAQGQPQISKGANSSLAVWTDSRTVLGRYVPDDTAGIGSKSDIYAARFDADGNLIDTTSIIVSQALYDQYYPHVGWNGQNWLVSWVRVRPTNQFSYDIVAVRISPEGVVLDAQPIVLNPPDDFGINYINITSDGNNWVVVWGSGGYHSKIYASRITAVGNLIDTSPKVLFDDGDNFHAPGFADITFVNNQFLAVWETTSNDNSIRAQKFDANLNPVGAEIGVGSPNANSARVATDGTNFFVAWREANGIYGARISAAGQVLDSEPLHLYGNSFDFVLGFYTALTWDGNAYVVASHLRTSGGTEQIAVSRVSNAGTILTPAPLLAGSNGSTQPSLAPRIGGASKLVWIDHSLSSDGDIFSANITVNNTVEAVAPVSFSAPRETQVRFTKTASGDFAYVYRSTVSGASSIYLQRLAASGTPVGEPTLVVQGVEAITTPAVAWNGSVYLVVWELNTQIYGRRVAADGAAIGAEFPVMRGNTPDVAALGTQFLTVVSFPETSQIRNTRAVRVDENGAVLGAPVKIGSNFDLRPRVRAFANRWLVVWESDPSHDNPDSYIKAAFVEPNGTSPGEFGISGIFSDTPHLAIGGDTALVVWENGGKIYGRRIKNDGTFLGNTFQIAQGPRTLFAPSAAWDGSRFVVTFADSRNSTLIPPADIWATLIGLDGTRLTPNNFPVAASPLPEEMPSVEAANGITVFGYSMFDDRAPYRSYRARLRRFPFDANFSVAVTPFQRQIAPGAATTFTVSVNAQNGFNGAVELNVFGLPLGATATFDPPTVTGSGSSNLTVTTANSTPEEIYRLTITATNEARQSSTEAILYVDDNPPPVGYAVTDLGTLGGTESAAFDINQSGQIVGYSLNASQTRRAFVYANGQMRDLGTLGGTTAAALAINDAGKIAGYSGINYSNDLRAFYYDGATMRNLGVYQSGGTSSGDFSAAYGINNSNQIVGEATATSPRIAFLYQNNQMSLVGSPYAFKVANNINDAGKIVGSQYVGDGVTKSYIINSDNTNPIFIETLGGRESFAQAINANDQVVGYSDTSPNNIFRHAFLYSGGQVRDINGLNAPQSLAYDINDSGIIVGNITLTDYSEPRAFVHDGTTMRNLNALIPQTSGWVLQEARGINNTGQIVGQGTINNQKHAFLLNPSGTQNAPPSIQIVSPTTNSNFSETSGITISADAFDTDGAIVRVEFYADGNLIGASTSQPYAILWTSAIPNHTYTLTAKAFDNAGAATVSAPVTITIGGTPQNVRTKFDFDGDGKADVSVFRPSNGVWYLNNSQTGFSAAQWGLASDALVPGDYDGDGKTDLAVFRRSANSTWYILQSQTNTVRAVQWGATNIEQQLLLSDRPVPADYDGDGKTDFAVWRLTDNLSEPARFLILQSSNNAAKVGQWGGVSDTPVPADYDGDGKADFAVFRHSQGIWYVLKSSDNNLLAVSFGTGSDRLVPGDYDGDGKADFAVFRDGIWYLQRSRDGFLGYQFGFGSDKPVPADYDGDGKIDIAVYRDGIWYLQRSQTGFTGIAFGAADDKPIPNAFVP